MWPIWTRTQTQMKRITFTSSATMPMWPSRIYSLVSHRLAPLSEKTIELLRDAPQPCRSWLVRIRNMSSDNRESMSHASSSEKKTRELFKCSPNTSRKVAVKNMHNFCLVTLKLTDFLRITADSGLKVMPVGGQLGLAIKVREELLTNMKILIIRVFSTFTSATWKSLTI